MPARLRAFTGIGIELEYAIVACDTLDVRPLAPDLLHDMAGHPAADVVRGALGWSNELVCHVVELKNVAPSPTLAPLAHGFHGEIVAANALLARFGATLMPGGMHPWMDPRAETRLWSGEGAPIYATFDRLFDARRHGWANLQSMHVNLPFATDEEFTRLHAAIRAVLPLVPALAASSPFCEGRRAAQLDHRLAVYAGNSARVPAIAGVVVPEDVADAAAYARCILAPMYAAIAPLDPAGVLQHEWLNARGAIARFDRSAIEIRLADAQECPQADLAIAAALVGGVRALYEERWVDLAALRALPQQSLVASLHACIRDAGDASLDADALLAAFGLRAPLPARAVWEHIVAQSRSTIDATFPPASRLLPTLLRHGTLAQRLVDRTGPDPSRAALRDTYAELCRCLAEGRLFGV